MAAVDKATLQKMLTDAGQTFAEDATVPQLLEQIQSALTSAAVAPEMVTYTVVQEIDIATEDDKTDVQAPGAVVELDANDSTVQEWLKEGRIEVKPTEVATPAAPAPTAGPVAPVAPQAPAAQAPAPVAGSTSFNTAMQAVIDKQNEEEKAKEMFDMTTREGRWIKFLSDARRVNPARFDRQYQAGEFDKIAPTFETPQFEKSVGTPRGTTS